MMLACSHPARGGVALKSRGGTGNRQGDLLRLPRFANDRERIRLRQRKSGARVKTPIGKPLKALPGRTTRRAAAIPTTRGKTVWTGSGFRVSWGRACKTAGVEAVTLHDLRGTVATRLAVAGRSVPEIASITGHSLKQVAAILDAHYLSRDSNLGASAIQKLEAHEHGKTLPS